MGLRHLGFQRLSTRFQPCYFLLFLRDDETERRCLGAQLKAMPTCFEVGLLCYLACQLAKYQLVGIRRKHPDSENSFSGGRIHL